MATYNIYSHSNGEDDSPIMATITLNGDGTEVLRVTSDDPSIRSEAESVLREYMRDDDGEDGMTALQAVMRYGGSYGEIRVINPDGSPAQVVEDGNNE